MITGEENKLVRFCIGSGTPVIKLNMYVPKDALRVDKVDKGIKA
jgi:hypothetical protein